MMVSGIFLMRSLAGIVEKWPWKVRFIRAGADDGQWHLPHAELGGHRGEVALEGEIHQGGMDDVVLMMA